MKRSILLSVALLVLLSLFGLALLRAQEVGGGGGGGQRATPTSVLPPPDGPVYHFYTNATGYGPNGDQPQSIAINQKTYYNVVRTNLTRWCGQVPADIFFKHPPGYDAAKHQAAYDRAPASAGGEQASIGNECSHAANDNLNMCELARTGLGDSGGAYKGPPQDQRAATADRTLMKQAVMDVLETAWKECDPLVDNFKDEYAGRIVMTQHSLQPLVTTIANEYGHARECLGRMQTYLAVFGIKEVPGIEANDPNNPTDLYYCDGKKLNYQDSLTGCKAVDVRGEVSPNRYDTR